jgi:hypothetical protein
MIWPSNRLPNHRAIRTGKISPRRWIPVSVVMGARMANLQVIPETVSLRPGGSGAFKALLDGAPAEHVAWRIAGDEESPGAAGTIGSDGLYQAPATITAPRTVTIEAASNGATATATVTLASAADTAPAATNAGETAPAAAGEATDTAGGAGGINSADADWTIRPARVVLGGGRLATFSALDTRGNPVAAVFSIVDAGGLSGDAQGALDATTGRYTAPPVVTAQGFLTIAATFQGRSDKAFIVLAPGEVTVTPADVFLRSGQRQVFVASVNGDAQATVEWQTPSPYLGHMATSGAYTAPDKIPEDQQVTVFAKGSVGPTMGAATVHLVADPWGGGGVLVLGLTLWALFAVVGLVYLKWPPPMDRARTEAAHSALANATQDWNTRLTLLKAAENAFAPLKSQSASPERSNAETSLIQRRAEVEDAKRIVDAREHDDLHQQKILEQTQEEERVLFVLVALVGALGSIVHISRSFMDFVGNRRLRPSWTWWYLLSPLNGAALAVIVYLALRGGFLPTAPPGGVNPFGFVAMAGLVGLFSKQATQKLDEVFTTLFRTDKPAELKDKLQRDDGKT